MKHYDFIVFENMHDLQHHRLDTFLIAKLLKAGGKSVAYFDIYGKENLSVVEGIDVIQHDFQSSLPDDTFMKGEFGKFRNCMDYFKFLYQQHIYMKEAISFIIDKADAFYCGSYNYYMSSLFFELKKPCFFWGLRSYYLSNPWNGGAKYLYPHRVKLKRKFLKNKCMRFFVSNEIIRNEFNSFGLSDDRMILREERCLYNFPQTYSEYINKELTFLIIGMLRPNKHVDVSINAFKCLDDPDTKLYIIGKSKAKGEYEQHIKSAIGNSSNIIRENRFLEYEDFNTNFRKSHFVIFGDEKNESSITNGTMLEALLNCRPIIAPDYLPYSYYIDKYNVGIKYDPSKKGALTGAMRKAKELGCNYFESHIIAYLENLRFDKISKQFCMDINKVLNKDEK